VVKIGLMIPVVRKLTLVVTSIHAELAPLAVRLSAEDGTVPFLDA